jgi:hypothetical protein
MKNKAFLDSLHFKILFTLWYCKQQGATEFTFIFTLLEEDLFLIWCLCFNLSKLYIIDSCGRNAKLRIVLET